MREKLLYVISSAVVLGALVAAGPALAQSTQAGGGWGGGGQHQQQPGVFGTVTAVSGDTLTVQNKGFGKNSTQTTYTVDASSATVTKNGGSSSVGSISVGDTVMVQGTVSGTSVTATKIEDGVAPGRGGAPGMMRPGVTGSVTAINGTTLTVASKAFGPKQTNANSTTYTVDASNATVFKNGATSTFSAIQTGDTVMVQGTVSGTSVTATRIEDGMPQGQGPRGPQTPPIQGNGEPVVGGSITAISGSTLTVTNKSNVTYSVDASNATVVVKNATSTLSSLAIGDNVIVQGAVNGNAVTASSVIDQGAPPASGASKGPLPAMRGVFGAIGGFFQHLFGFF